MVKYVILNLEVHQYYFHYIFGYPKMSCMFEDARIFQDLESAQKIANQLICKNKIITLDEAIKYEAQRDSKNISAFGTLNSNF